MASTPPYRLIADRFRYFLKTTGLSRDEFAAAVDGAIEPRSLFSIMNGTRRPSRALAVIIERTWGFSADFLLEGVGPMWEPLARTARAAEGSSLSRPEAAVVDFMRASVMNARTMERHLEESKIWTRLFDRAMALVTDLDSCGLSESEADRRVYPVFARLVYEDCVFMASTYERLVALRFRRVVHQLIGLFLGRFIEEVPRGALPDAEAKKLADLLGPVQRRRQEALHNLDEAIEQVEKTVDEICRMGSLSERLRAHSESSASRRRLELLERIAERAPQGLREEIESLVAELEAETDLATTYRPQIERLLRDLLEHSGQAATASVLETLTLDQLRARCDALLDPLTT